MPDFRYLSGFAHTTNHSDSKYTSADVKLESFISFDEVSVDEMYRKCISCTTIQCTLKISVFAFMKYHSRDCVSNFKMLFQWKPNICSVSGFFFSSLLFSILGKLACLKHPVIKATEAHMIS